MATVKMMATQELEYSFRGQRPNETILLVAKQHIWSFSTAVCLWTVIILLGLLAIKFFGASAVSSLVIATGVLIGLIITIRHWFLWTNGVYLVTNQRVIKTDQLGFFKRLISEAELDRIQEITTEIGGPIRTMLNFGTVHIQTASRSGKIDLENVPSPYDIQQTIVRARQTLVASGQATDIAVSTDDQAGS